MAGNLVISQINGGPIGVINAIINGNFQVNQRGVSGTVTLAAGAYGHDRWKAGASGCTYTFATSNNVTTLTITAGSLIQVIEGINLYSGTYALSWSGTAQGKIGAGSYSGSGVTGSVTGGTNLNIEFNTGTLSLVQFEPGTEVSPFERRDYGRELVMCQRYAVMINSSNANGTYLRYGAGENPSTTVSNVIISLPCPMRIVPSATTPSATLFSIYSAGSAFQCTSVGIGGDGSGINSFVNVSCTVASGLTLGYASNLISNNNKTSYILFSSEL